MLLEFGAKNFYNFKEGFEVSLRLKSVCPEEISHNRDYANILGLKGANGSGKTNVLKALSFLSFFCCNSFNEKPDETIKLESFFRNPEPTEFFIVFQEKNVEYRYELSLTTQEVISEKLFRKGKKQTRVIERNTDSFSYVHPDFKKLKDMKLRKNASFISTANQYEISSVRTIYFFFQKIISNVSYPGMLPLIFNYIWGLSPDSISKYYHNDPQTFDFVKAMLSKCDLGIHEVKIEVTTDEDGSQKYYPIFGHKVGSEMFFLPYINQSSGTQALYLQLGFYHFALTFGGVLVLDEFDSNLHPDILPMLVKLFEDEEINQKNAQLLFTTHNSDIMDQLSKYRTVLISKEENESYLYRLDEIPGDILRNDRMISPIYKAGKIGGVPKI